MLQGLAVPIKSEAHAKAFLIACISLSNLSRFSGLSNYHIDLLIHKQCLQFRSVVRLHFTAQDEAYLSSAQSAIKQLFFFF
jgi:hypothetical protein